MLKLKLSPQAIADIELIYEYTLKTWNKTQADKYQDELYASMLNILGNPKLGAAYYFKEGNYRKLNTNRHLIFYTCNEEDCIIMRVLHERMDLGSHL